MKTAEKCQTEKCGRNEMFTVAKFQLTNQMVVIVNCIFLFIVFVGCIQQRQFYLKYLKIDRTFVFLCKTEDFA